MRKLFFVYLVGMLVFVPLGVMGEGFYPGTSNIKSIDDCNKCKAPMPNEACKQYCGVYSVDEFMGKFYVGYTGFLWSILGSLSLLMFVVGGLMWILSAGNKTWIDRGRMTIVGAVTGLFIAFFGYVLVNFVFETVVDDGYKDNPFSTGMDDKRPAPTNSNPPTN